MLLSIWRQDMKKIKLRTKVILSLFMIIVLVFGGTFAYTFYQLSKVKTVEISKDDKDLGIKVKDPIKEEESEEIINIALFGLDRRSKDEPARSDSIMILTIDKKHNKIKMSSIMRDTYVKINGHGETKINHAYAFGGPQLAIRTLNENFDLDIRDYVAVDFFNAEALIDAMGGVTIDVNQEEIGLINSGAAGVAKLENKTVPTISATGPQTLNGLQAVAYSRIRYLAGGDFVRTERQRTVLSAMIAKLQSLKPTEIPSAVSKLLPFTETSINSIDIMKLGSKVITTKKMVLEQQRFPLDGYCRGKTIDGVWYLVADMDPTVDQLHKFIYEDIKPVPKSPQF
jgi:LCP family protein required for cell wall assembly